MQTNIQINKNSDSPLPLRPTNLKSLNLATPFLKVACAFLSSPQKFSSLPALTVTAVPSATSPRHTTLKAAGRVLLDRQCEGRAVHTKHGLPVLTSSAADEASIPAASSDFSVDGKQKSPPLISP